jgi:hypothetical protein
MYCLYCNMQGHIVDNCLKLLNTKCTVCDKAGHTKKFCKIMICLFCKQTDHNIDTCKKLFNTKCKNCKQFGHIKKYCNVEDRTIINICEDDVEFMDAINWCKKQVSLKFLLINKKL